MRFASLGSGSEGNALVVEAGQSRVLLDCGFSATETVRRLARLALEPLAIDAVLVTHEHADHVGGVARFARRYGIPVYLSYGTYAAAATDGEFCDAVIIDSHTPFAVGDVEIFPYPVPHDAREPTQFVFGDGARRLGVLTDAGSSTPHIEAMLSGLDALVIECNHDRELLLAGNYPEHLKHRISGRYGHLDNGQAAQIVARIDQQSLRHVVAAHLSRKNNRPDLACAALADALGCTVDWIGVASQQDGFDWRMLD
ncbi:MAG: MBL fold metallo-hydrolase [Betaproteobacteria bacterium]|nr:MAG: MBL fold metallo-hydrolase [Betaproteobacteria bacterium]